MSVYGTLCSLVVGHQGSIHYPRSTLNTYHDLLSIPQLWHCLGMHKRGHLNTWNPDRTQPIHGLYFQLCRDELWLNLKAIARPNFANGNNIGWHELPFPQATCFRTTVAYSVYAGQRTPEQDCY